jgi:hypothetical protein
VGRDPLSKVVERCDRRLDACKRRRTRERPERTQRAERERRERPRRGAREATGTPARWRRVVLVGLGEQGRPIAGGGRLGRLRCTRLLTCQHVGGEHRASRRADDPLDRARLDPAGLAHRRQHACHPRGTDRAAGAQHEHVGSLHRPDGSHAPPSARLCVITYRRT